MQFMAAFHAQVYRSAAQADERLVKYVADAAERFKAEVLFAVFNPVDGALTGTEFTGKSGLGKPSLLPYLVNKLTYFFVSGLHRPEYDTTRGIFCNSFIRDIKTVRIWP